MITDTNQTIREILLVDGGISLNEIDISFEIPDREWSSRIARPTLNCYLFDLRERPAMREQGWQVERDQRVARRQPPLRYGLTYLVTAWTRHVEDEHRLLWHALQTLARFPTWPENRLQGQLAGIIKESGPIYAEVARPESVLKSPGEFWTALENHLKPSLSYTVTVPLDREAVIAGPPVSSFRLRLGTAEIPPEELAWLGGVVVNAADEPLPGALIHVVGQGVRATTDALGRFRLAGLSDGEHTLVIATPTATYERRLHVPSAAENYRIQLE